MPRITPHGLVDQSSLNRKNDYLYRISIKGLIKNELGEVLVVKESGRTWWDLPGGGMDHGEDIKSAIARELKEEVNLEGDFSYKIIAIDEPVYLPNANVYQIRLIFRVISEATQFTPGIDGDEVTYINIDDLKLSDNPVERKVFEYASIS